MRTRPGEIAREVLERIAREPDEPETPYWRAATEAEALLLLGRRDEARAALERAVAAAPQAWEDHASTLRQFLAIREALGVDRRLARHAAAAPLASLCRRQAGRRDGRRRRAGSLDPNIGFGFGALAAGAEIAAAEALLERGGQLHVVLPSDAASFAAAFVDPHGADWRQRFDAALGRRRERSLRAAAPSSAGRRDHRAGRPDRPWRGPAQRRTPDGPGAVVAPASRVADGGIALLAIRVGESEADEFEDRLGEARRALDAAGPAALAPFLSGETILVGYPDPAGAALAARTLHARLHDGLPLQVAGHYGLIDCVRDPFSGTSRPAGSGVDIVQAIADATPPGSICVSDDFAAVLAADAGRATDANWIGEINAFDGGSAIGLRAPANKLVRRKLRCPSLSRLLPGV